MVQQIDMQFLELRIDCSSERGTLKTLACFHFKYHNPMEYIYIAKLHCTQASVAPYSTNVLNRTWNLRLGDKAYTSIYNIYI